MSETKIMDKMTCFFLVSYKYLYTFGIQSESMMLNDNAQLSAARWTAYRGIVTYVIHYQT